MLRILLLTLFKHLAFKQPIFLTHFKLQVACKKKIVKNSAVREVLITNFWFFEIILLLQIIVVRYFKMMTKLN